MTTSNGAIDRNLQTYGIGDTRTAEQPRQRSKANDQVNLSVAAKDAERLSNLADQSRSDRLEAVRQAIADGTYSVSGGDIAQNMIEWNTR
jgi:flagellar biosynthesis anti-sigma factor FlgM